MEETIESYTSLRKVTKRKEQVLKELRADSDKIDKLRKQLTHKDSALGSKSKAFNPSVLLSAGALLLDTAAVAWRIYNKFKK